MGLLDDEIKSIKSEYVRKPEWALCKYCKVPFLTFTFSDSCERCSHFVQYNIEFTSKLMIIYVLFVSIFILSSIFLLLYSWKFTQSYMILLLIIAISATVQGSILWKIVKLILNK